MGAETYGLIVEGKPTQEREVSHHRAIIYPVLVFSKQSPTMLTRCVHMISAHGRPEAIAIFREVWRLDAREQAYMLSDAAILASPHPSMSLHVESLGAKGHVLSRAQYEAWLMSSCVDSVDGRPAAWTEIE